ncbi:hypothetical protein QBC38DRAFT_72476 [Podospora fimiseda]|uniref:F-box domain-containing protein n=1 Tax=Podospora fimiseda TaxID=252190 RepID=A0AAN6YNT8_9PEZI|nr:hypothetical protein QBC38DRAFT_72476 [Podospora fimiseda]
MNSLPQEITSLITSNLEPPLSPYASISRQFQHAIEHDTFNSITTNSDSFQSEFASAFSDDPNKVHRRGLLRSLEYNIVLASPSKKRMRKMQSTAEKEENDKIFTREVKKLFEFFKSWNDEDPGVKLTITPMAKCDLYAAGGVQGMKDQLKEIGFDGAEMELIPAAGVIRHLDIGCGPGRRIDPAGLRILAKATPKLTGFDMWFYPVGKRLMDERRRWRSRLADSLLSLATTNGMLEHLTMLRIFIADKEPWNQNCEPGRLVQEGGRDRLSVAIRKISQLPALKELILQGQHIISSELFEDRDGKDSGTWPSLTSIELSMSLISPDGHWAIAGNPDSQEPLSEEEEDESDVGDDESQIASEDSNTSDYVSEAKWRRENGEFPQHFFRGQPVDSVLEPVMAAMARATTRMPKLEFIKFYIQGGYPLATITVEYYGPGNTAWVPDDHPDREGNWEAVNSTSAGPRWILYLNQGFWRWTIPRELKTALVESVGEGNVRLMRTWTDDDTQVSEIEVERF